MHDVDIAADAARHCIRLGMGLTTPEAVVRWADDIVLSQAQPSDEIITLASAFALPGWVVLDRVKALTTREELVSALREAAGEVRSLHAQGTLGLRDGVERLLGWARTMRLWEYGSYRDIYWTLDEAATALYLADTGLRQHEEVELSVLEDLARLATDG
jgi:hypothetical protein